MMLQRVVLCCLVVLALAGRAEAGTQADVRGRGFLRCGIEQAPGLAWPDSRGVWRGFDVEICRAIATMALGRPTVQYIVLDADGAVKALSQRRVDVVARVAQSWQMQAEGAVVVSRASYYDAIGVMAPRALGIKSLRDLGGARVCAHPAAVQALEALVRDRDLKIRVMPMNSLTALQKTYAREGCDAVAAPFVMLAGIKSLATQPGEQVIVSDALAKWPSGPGVSSRDVAWSQLVGSSVDGLIWAEELGISTDGVWPKTAAVERLVGSRTERMIRTVGHYGDMFERTLGRSGGLKLKRGQNALWSKGGMMYAAPQ